jgi:hypothetical protein
MLVAGHREIFRRQSIRERSASSGVSVQAISGRKRRRSATAGRSKSHYIAISGLIQSREPAVRFSRWKSPKWPRTAERTEALMMLGSWIGWAWR